jgi:hypothetical protein
MAQNLPSSIVYRLSSAGMGSHQALLPAIRKPVRS